MINLAPTDSPVNPDGPDEPRPTAGPDSRPTAIDEAYWAGFLLGLDGEYPAPPDHYSHREGFHFTCGRLAGYQESEAGQEWASEMEAIRDRAFADPYDLISESELIESRGYRPPTPYVD